MMTDAERIDALEESITSLAKSLATLAQAVREHVAADSLALEHKLSDLAIMAAGLAAAPSKSRTVQ